MVVLGDRVEEFPVVACVCDSSLLGWFGLVLKQVIAGVFTILLYFLSETERRNLINNKKVQPIDRITDEPV